MTKGLTKDDNPANLKWMEMDPLIIKQFRFFFNTIIEVCVSDSLKAGVIAVASLGYGGICQMQLQESRWGFYLLIYLNGFTSTKGQFVDHHDYYRSFWRLEEVHYYSLILFVFN